MCVWRQIKPIVFPSGRSFCTPPPSPVWRRRRLASTQLCWLPSLPARGLPITQLATATATLLPLPTLRIPRALIKFGRCRQVCCNLAMAASNGFQWLPIARNDLRASGPAFRARRRPMFSLLSKQRPINQSRRLNKQMRANSPSKPAGRFGTQVKFLQTWPSAVNNSSSGSRGGNNNNNGSHAQVDPLT